MAKSKKPATSETPSEPNTELALSNTGGNAIAPTTELGIQLANDDFVAIALTEAESSFEEALRATVAKAKYHEDVAAKKTADAAAIIAAMPITAAEDRAAAIAKALEPVNISVKVRHTRETEVKDNTITVTTGIEFFDGELPKTGYRYSNSDLDLTHKIRIPVDAIELRTAADKHTAFAKQCREHAAVLKGKLNDTDRLERKVRAALSKKLLTKSDQGTELIAAMKAALGADLDGIMPPDFTD